MRSIVIISDQAYYTEDGSAGSPTGKSVITTQDIGGVLLYELKWLVRGNGTI